MEEKNSTKKYYIFNTRIQRIIRWAKKISMPGFEGIPIYDVVIFFFKGLQRGAITTRAAAIAFQFALASLPVLLLIFTIIPYIPIHNLKIELLDILNDILPTNVFSSMSFTMDDLTMRAAGLQFFGLCVAVWFGTNGINAIIKAFNATFHTIESRSSIETRLISFLMVIIFSLLVTISAILIIFGKKTLTLMIENEILNSGFTYYLIYFIKWPVIVAMIFFAISFLYYFAPAKKTKFKFISAGSTLASILSIIASLGFSYFVGHFGQFNKYFGSIGTLIVFLIWLNFLAIALLIGFELNASIKNAGSNKEFKLQPSDMMMDEVELK